MMLGRNMMRSAMIMSIFTLVFTALMAGVYYLTQARVAKNEIQAKWAVLAQVLPKGSYDNDLLAASVTLTEAQSRDLGHERLSQIYLAKKQGITQSVIVEAIAPDGYGGKIKLLIGIGQNEQILAVRVLSHQETPGLGDYIELAKSNWILQFQDKSLKNPTMARWCVKKEGGEFDYMSGATITSRAVVKAIQKALVFVQKNRNHLFV